jgi:hypothetical protein
MAANASWAIELPAINHPASLEIEDATSANVELDNNELSGSGLPRIVGNSAALRRVLGMVWIVAPTDATVLIGGNRNRQGTDCGSHSQMQRPIERPVCEGELRRNSCRFA